MKIPLVEGATILDPDSLRGLIPKITLKDELDEFEQANIAEAMLWARKSRKLRKDLLTASGICLLHEKMFNEVWTWAGKFRTIGMNIGVEPSMIQNQLGALLGDIKYWIEDETYTPDEIAVRFHHRLVFIHPFPNGNGRCTRFAADLLAKQLGSVAFTWGGKNLSQDSGTKTEYIAALKHADRMFEYDLLLKFARS